MTDRCRPTVLALIGALLALGVGTARGDTDPIVSFRVSFPERGNHLIDVVAEVSTGGRDEVVLWMPTWTPGSYKIRDYSRYILSLEARTPGGAPLRVRKETKNTWRVPCAGLDRFELRYQVLGAELSVRTCFVEDRFASLVGAALWLIPLEPEVGTFDLRFHLPPEWPDCETALPPHPSGDAHRFLAPDFDTLLDSPIVLGTIDRRRFEVGGVPHSLASIGGDGLWDFERAAEDCRRIAEAQAAFWGSIPYESFRILNLVVEGKGGLEHTRSAHVMTSRDSFRDPERYRGWLSLVSHELFHAWNGKQLSPAIFMLCSRDRDEVHSPDLWVVEGLTSYYEDVILARAGLLDRKQYLEALSKSIEELQTTPGRQVHSLAAASHDAWTHHYQPHAHSKNTTISYYTKGAVVGLLLDAAIRTASAGERSLDDAMRLALARHPAPVGYSSEEFRRCCSDTAGSDLSAFFAVAVDSTEELDYAPALEWFGLRFRPAEPAAKVPARESDSAPRPPAGAEEGDGGGGAPAAEAEEPPKGWIGAATASREGRVVVTEVPRDTIAAEVGLAVDDEIIAVAGIRLGAGGWDERMRQHRPGETVDLLIARRGGLRTIAVTLGEKPKETWKLELREDATPEQKARVAAWLGAAGADLLPPPGDG